MGVRRFGFLVIVQLLLVACSAGGQAPAAAKEKAASFLIRDVPFLKQKPGFGGEACAAIMLAKLGKDLGQDDVFNASGVDASLGRGCDPEELARALARVGFDTGPAWRELPAQGREAAAQALFKEILGDLAQGIASIVYTGGDPSNALEECYRLVLGFDGASQEVVYHDPSLREGAYRRMPVASFLGLWPRPHGGGLWGLARVRLKPAGIKDHSPSRGLTEAAYAQRIIELKNKLEGKGFHIVLERPFVVVGDESPEVVQRRAADTVRWAVERLKRDFFPSDPKEVLDIWLFKDDESYREHALEFFHDEPSSPYGYFLASGHALIMNIGTGGGTLVHEIVHPFMETNFPACPPWLNEGLASLYEQSGDKGGHIVGYTNWRLPGLQEVIREGDLSSFQSLFALTAEQFYGARSGRNYAQARYLCYYLQEKGLLVDYFKKFSASVYEDYTGYKTLQEVLGEKDMAAFQKRWEAWVLTLRR